MSMGRCCAAFDCSNIDEKNKNNSLGLYVSSLSFDYMQHNTFPCLKMGAKKRKLECLDQQDETSLSPVIKSKRQDTSNEKSQDFTVEDQDLMKNFSEVDFKFLLNDPETVDKGLNNFIAAAQAEEDGAISSNVVGGYCKSTTDCSELINLLDHTKEPKPKRVSMVFSCLEKILVQCSEEEKKLSKLGDAIVQKILSGHMATVYNSLRSQNRSTIIKSTLKMLISMVMLNDKSKKLVQSRLKFDHPHFAELFQRRNRKDSQDIRSCMILLTFAFIIEGDQTITCTLVQQKTFLQMIISGLVLDPRDTVVDVLATLSDKVLQCPSVSKTNKIKLFSESVLKQISGLFEWKGPAGFLAKTKKEEEKIEDSEFLADKKIIGDVTQKFLIELCCSTKYGIAFHDKTLGTGPRNLNQLLSHFLRSLVNSMENTLTTELVLKILTACPDQISHFLTNLSSVQPPRWSEIWESRMNFLIRLYKDVVVQSKTAFETSDSTKDVNSKAIIFCALPLGLSSLLQDSLSHEDVRVRDKGLQLLLSLVNNSVSISKLLVEEFGQNRTEDYAKLLVDDFTLTCLKSFPSAASVFSCSEKISKIVTGTKSPKTEDTQSLVSKTVLLLQVLSVYQRLQPSVLSDNPKQLVSVVDLVTKLMKDEESLKTTDQSPYFHLLLLLSNADARKISLGKDGLLEKLLSSAGSSSKQRDGLIHFVCKMLNSLDLFSSYESELSLWLDEALPDKDTKQGVAMTAVKFLSKCLTTLINNPAPSVERLTNIVNETRLLKSNVDKRGTVMEYEDVLRMDDEELDELVARTETTGGIDQSSHEQALSSSLPFSPLILVALDNLQYSKSVVKEERRYVCRMILHILHITQDNEALSAILQTSEADIDERVMLYVKHKFPANIKPHLPDFCTEISQRILEACASLDKDCDSLYDRLSQQFDQLSSSRKYAALSQVLFYLTSTIQDSDKLNSDKKLQILRSCKLIENIFSWTADKLVSLKEDENIIKQNEISKKSRDQEDDVNSNDNEDNESSDLESSSPEELQNTSNDSAVQHLLSTTISENNVLLRFYTKIFSTQSITDLFFSEVKPNQNKTNLKSQYVVSKISKLLSNILQIFYKLNLKGEERKKCVKDIFKVVQERIDFFELLASKLQDLYLNFVLSISDALTLLELSQIVVKLIEKLADTDLLLVDNKPTLSNFGSIIVEIVSVWCTKLKTDSEKQKIQLKEIMPDFDKISNIVGEFSSSNSLLSGFLERHEGLSLITKTCQSFSLQRQCGISMSQLSPFVDLLFKCRDEDFITCVTSLLENIPEASTAFSQKLRDYLLVTASKHDHSIEKVLKSLIQSSPVEDLEPIVAWLKKNLGKIESKRLWWLLVAMLKRINGSVKDKELLDMIKEALTLSMKQNMKTSNIDILDTLRLFYSNLDLSDKEFVQKTFNSILGACDSQQTLSKLHVNVFQATGKFLPEFTDEVLQRCLKLCLSTLTNHISKKSSVNFEEELLDLNLQLTSAMKDSIKADTLTSWPQFVKVSLKNQYSSPKVLKLLSSLVPLIYRKSSASQPPLSAAILFNMCVSHSSFLSTMFTGSTQTKENLVGLLFSLFTVDKSCVTNKLTDVLLGAYSATLSLTDQKLLLMIRNCNSGEDSKFESLSLWGEASVEHKSVSQALGPSLDNQVPVKRVLEQLDVDTLHRSMLAFPFRRPVQPVDVQEASVYKSEPTCYDPSFLLKLFSHCLLSDKVVPLRLFVERGCLGYLIVSLSSHVEETRLVAYKCLNDFYTHAEGSRVKEKMEITFLLDLINASRTIDSQKIPFSLALFFAKVAILFLNPGDHMYFPIFRFLMAKPEIDLGNVPEFYQLFFSSTNQYKIERNWMLTHLTEGVRETLDYRIYQKRYIYKLVLGFCDSSLSDNTSQELVLKLVLNTCKLKQAAVDLVKNHGFLSWLLGIVNKLSYRSQQLPLVLDIIDSLWSSLSTHQAVHIPRYPQDGNSDKPDVTNHDSENQHIAMEQDATPNLDTTKPVLEKTSRIPKSTLVEMTIILQTLLLNSQNTEDSSSSLAKALAILHQVQHYS